MSAIVQREADLYTELWSSVEPYAEVSPGEQHVAMFQAMTGATSGTVLDAGCGSGKGALALDKAGFTVTLCDLTEAGLPDEMHDYFQFSQISLWHDLTSLVYLARVRHDGIHEMVGVNPYEHGQFDYVYCCDVLEHIPTEYTMLTLSRLLEVAKHGVFLTIALVPDQFGIWVGQPLHHTVQSFTWWRDRLRDLGELVECRDCLMYGVYLVKPR